MKRYKFSLGSVLRVRKVEEDQAIVAFAAAERARASAAEDVVRRESAHRAALGTDSHATATAFMAQRERLERSALAVRESNDMEVKRSGKLQLALSSIPFGASIFIARRLISL